MGGIFIADAVSAVDTSWGAQLIAMITGAIPFSVVVGLIVSCVGAGLVYHFGWFGIRKFVGVMLSAVTKGKIRI